MIQAEDGTDHAQHCPYVIEWRGRFKAASIITLLVGAYMLIYVRNHYLNSWREQLSIGGGAVFLAAALAISGYLLDMLRSLLQETRRQGSR